MTATKVSPERKINYIIESTNGFYWEQEYIFDNLEEATKELEKIKASQWKGKFRIICSEWWVVVE